MIRKFCPVSFSKSRTCAGAQRSSADPEQMATLGTLMVTKCYHSSRRRLACPPRVAVGTRVTGRQKWTTMGVRMVREAGGHLPEELKELHDALVNTESVEQFLH